MSTDYTSCSGENCPVKENCHRFNGPKDPVYQNYFREIPGEWIYDQPSGLDELNSKRKWKCDMFWSSRQFSIIEQLNDILNGN